VTLPLQLPGLHVAALLVWALAATMLLVLSLAWAVHWTRHRGTARGHALNPVMAQFYGAPPMALLTVGPARCYWAAMCSGKRRPSVSR
jgi:tellurite resistance protein TehA-like permease